MFAVYQKELKAYFNNLFGYLYVAIILLFMGIFATFYHFSNYLVADLAYSLDNLAIVVMLVSPLLTMRIIAEERQRKTDQLLYSLPLSVTSTVVAKYLAMVTVYLVPMLIISVYPFVLASFGIVNFARTFGSILGFFLMGSCLLAIGMFISALTENQIVSAIISFVTMLIIYFSSSISRMIPSDSMSSFIAITVLIVILGIVVYIMVKNYVAALAVMAVFEVVLAVFYKINVTAFEGLFAKIVGWISVYERCASFYNGIFDLTSILYFLSVSFLFVFLSIQAVEKRRWS